MRARLAGATLERLPAVRAIAPIASIASRFSWSFPVTLTGAWVVRRATRVAVRGRVVQKVQREEYPFVFVLLIPVRTPFFRGECYGLGHGAPVPEATNNRRPGTVIIIINEVGFERSAHFVTDPDAGVLLL